MSLELDEQYEKIYKYCYFKIKNKDIAEDLTQEAFLKYFAQSAYISHGKPLAYLYTIAKNQCIDYLRKPKLEQLDDDFAAEECFNEVETGLAIKQAVSKLTVTQQELILLRYANELAIGEIALTLGISRFAVNRGLKSALNKLKQHLRKEDFNE